MIFKYIQAGLWHRPIINIEMIHKGQSLRYLALIDSGADFNIFHKDLADVLGINLSKLKKVQFSGISSSVKQCEGSFVELELNIGGIFIKTMTLFSSDISDDGYGILGQQGFFNNFKVAFHYSKRQIIINSNSSKVKVKN